MENKNVCSGGPELIFACSGAADVGHVADLAGRKMTQLGRGQMFCLAGIGGQVGPIMQKTSQAAKILAIDGCGMNCVKGCLENAGFNQFSHLQLGELGLEKGKSPATDENIDRVVQAGIEKLST